jgi:hypothetical protein
MGRASRINHPLVTVGLDPGLHLILACSPMDCRVKPGNDD